MTGQKKQHRHIREMDVADFRQGSLSEKESVSGQQC